MKRILLFISSIASLLLFSTMARSQDIPKDDEEKVVIVIDESSQGNGHGRSIPSVPFSVVLIRTMSYIEVNFIDLIGDVRISLCNLTTGNNTEMSVSSSSGNTLVPILFGSGLYIIEFFTSDGETYSGVFVF